MPIQLSNFNCVYLKSTIASKYSGGIEQFKKDLKHGNVPLDAEDNFLLSFAFMNYTDNAIADLKLDEDYAIVGKWQRNENCKWLKENGLYFWHIDYNYRNPEYDKFLSQTISMDAIFEQVEKSPLPSSFS